MSDPNIVVGSGGVRWTAGDAPVTIDLRDREINALDDLASVYAEHQTLQTTGRMLKLEVIVSPVQRATIYRLLRRQSPLTPLPEGNRAQWAGITITTA